MTFTIPIFAFFVVITIVFISNSDIITTRTKWKRQTSLGLEMLEPTRTLPPPPPSYHLDPQVFLHTSSQSPLKPKTQQAALELYYRSQLRHLPLLGLAAQSLTVTTTTSGGQGQGMGSLPHHQYSAYLAHLAARAAAASASQPSPPPSPPSPKSALKEEKEELQ